MSGIRGRMAAATGGASAVPLAVLFGLNFVDEFDRIAFAALTPEIRDAFGLSDTGIGAIGVVSSVFVLLAALPMGFIADRFNRVKVSAGAAVLWGAMSVLTGVVPVVALLFVVRLLSGVGRIVNEVVHPSLLADYYRPGVHPRVFQIHRLANPVSAISGVIAGAIAVAIGWEWAFILLAIPTFLLLTTLTRIREPRRGESLDADLADEMASSGDPIPFAEARRQLFAIRTLRRLWVGAFFLGVGYLSIGQLLALFFEEVYGYGPFGRGVIQFVFGAGTVVGLLIGGHMATDATRVGDRARLATITGLSFVQFAAGLILMAVAPWSLASAFFAFVLSIGVGAYQPAYFPLVGQVAPPRIRSQAYAYAIVWVGLGGFASIFLFGLGDSAGYRVAIGVLSAIIAIAGAIGASASRFVSRDIEQAESSLATAVAIRREMAETGTRALLTCKGVEVAYDQVQVLFGVDIEVRPGEVVALLGTNGAGKSTLLKAISGTVDPIGGAIFFDGRDITHADGAQTTALGVIQVPGGRAVFPTLTVAEHLRAAGWLYRRDADYLRDATEQVLETFPRLRERYDQLAGNLSGGEQQMLALGMAFVAKPKLLMIDELSLGLAPTIVEQLLGIVGQIRDQGTAIVLVEQSINVALTVAERAYFMEKGEIRFHGATAELLERDDIVRSVFLEGAAAATGNGAKQRRKVAAQPRRRVAPTDPESVLDVHGLVKRFGGVRAVNEASLSLHRGEILGLIGPNGAGKTTIFDLISGFLVPDAGRITLDGDDITATAPDRRAWLGLGRSFQDARLLPSLTVTENIAIGLERHLELRDHVAAGLNLPEVIRVEEDVAWTVEELVELMGLTAYRDKFVRELSTGSRRIVDLAMCIAHDPKVLLLDEPSSGIAQRETEALGPLLEEIQAETGCSLLVIEHDMPLITSISDRMIALELGTPIAEGVPQDVIRDPQVVSSYLGGDMRAIHRSGRQSRPRPSRAGKSGTGRARRRPLSARPAGGEERS